MVSKEIPFILISSLVLGFLSQLQIFRAYSKVFDRVWHAVFDKHKSCGISGQIFGLILSFLCNRELRVALENEAFSNRRLHSWS